MASQLTAQSDFTETFAVHMAIKSALKVRKAAEKLCQELEGEHSIYGRQLKMIRLMEKGASLPELGRKLHCSRRTVFRYLNHLEDAGISIELVGTAYRVDKGVVRMLKA